VERIKHVSHPIRAGHYRNGPGHIARPDARTRNDRTHAGFRFPTKEVNMLRKLYLVPVLALLAIPALASAQFEAGNYALELSGSGSNDQDFTTGNAAVNLNLGYFMTKELELGVRQGIVWADGGSAWSGQTVVAADWHFDMDRWQPYIGANIGYVYGDGVQDTFEAAPEAGIKFFVNSTTFIQVGVEYQFFFNNGDDASQSFSDGQFVYGANIGFRWH